MVNRATTCLERSDTVQGLHMRGAWHLSQIPSCSAIHEWTHRLNKHGMDQPVHSSVRLDSGLSASVHPSRSRQE